MSTNYSQNIVVGFRFGMEEFLKPFECWILPRKTHKEDHVHSGTGKKIKTVEVVDQEGIKGWRLGKTGKKCEDEFDFLNEFNVAGATADTSGCSEQDELDVIVYLDVEPVQGTGLDEDRTTYGGDLPFDEVCALRPLLERLKGELTKLGLKPGKPCIINNWSIS